MSPDPDWFDLGDAESLQDPPLREVLAGRTKIALSYRGGAFGAVSGVCNHAAGPLGRGTLDGDYIQCPWHYWKFHRVTGLGEPGFEADRVPRHETKVENGRLFVRAKAATKRERAPHEPHPLAREVERAPGGLRVAGISTTVMDTAHPRYSTSEDLLETTLATARDELGAETRMLKLSELAFRACEGFYSKSAHACTWPCSITQMDPADRMVEVYEALVHWADVVLIATPIRWGAASSLWFKMVERLNCVQNQITLSNRVLIRDKVAALIITGGQDNVQAVAGQMLTFLGEIGFLFPPFPFVAHSLGWTAEDMERNATFVQQNAALHEGSRELVRRAAALSVSVRGAGVCKQRVERGGRKAGKAAEQRGD